jgi:hypothetical protein
MLIRDDRMGVAPGAYKAGKARTRLEIYRGNLKCFFNRTEYEENGNSIYPLEGFS